MENRVVTLPDSCTVRMDGKLYESRDFVAVLSKEDGDASILYNTDAMTLGMAIKLVSREYIRCINECTPLEQSEIESILGEIFVSERIDAENEEDRS